MASSIPFQAKASEQFRERLVSRYYSATRHLARPDPGFGPTDSDARNFTPKPSPDTALNAFAQLLLLRLNASHALISLIDSRHQYVLAEAAKPSAAHSTATLKDGNALWIGSVVLPRETAICSVVLTNSSESASYRSQDPSSEPDVVVIKDLMEDSRFNDRRFVVGGPQMRWFAGAPIRSPDGIKLGAVCVFDLQPRQGLTEEERGFLCESANTVTNHLEAVRARSEFQRRDRLFEGLESFVSGLTELMSHRPEIVDPDIASRDLTSPYMSHGSEISSMRSMTMWEAALPSGCKLMFSRAANIVRDAGRYDGATFFYVPSIESSAKSRLPQGRPDKHVRPRTRRPTTSSSSASSSEPEESTGSIDSQLDQDQSRDQSSGDETGSESLCPVLGFSMSQAEEQVRSSNQLQFPRFLVRDMQRLMGSRPRGRVYLLDSLGASVPGDTASSGSGGETHGSDPQSITAISSPIPEKSRKKSRVGQIKALLKLEPHARAFVCVPLWDYTRQRWFAFCVCWILKPTRDPAADRDLRFLQVFGNSITNALAHLDSLEESRAKDTFVSSVSHELRSPLHGILGATNFLYETGIGRFQREMVDTISSCGRTLLDSLEHIMDFAKINNFSKSSNNMLEKVTSPKKQEVESRRKRALAASSLTSSVDMSLVIEEVVEAIVLGFTIQHDFLHSEDAIAGIGVRIPSFTTKPQDLSKSNRAESIRGRVRLCLDLPATDSHFETQPGAWRRIIMNLVGNALKYTDEGSISISLRIQDTESDMESQESETLLKPKEGAWLVLQIRDTGIGMSNEFMHNHLFKAFAQEDSLAVGTGLGLSIIDQVVTSMDGHVEVSSTKGFGSTFGVRVMLKKAQNRDVETNLVTSMMDRLKGRRICILEDTHSKGSENNSESTIRSEEQFSKSLIRTLKDWFAMDTVVTSQFEPHSATDVVICLEPSFRQLQTVRSASVGGEVPPVLFIAHDALEVSVLRADSRVTSDESFVEITCQPLGPRKIAAALAHCLDQAALSRLSSPKLSAAGQEHENAFPHSRKVSQDANSVLDAKMRPSTPQRIMLEREDSLGKHENRDRKDSTFVLCVDDNPLNLKLLTTFVRRNKLPFDQAVNGQEAVDMYIAAPTSYRCLLMDISMPVMDGMTATRHIREYEAEHSLPRVPIFALTGLASAAARNEALEVGIDRLFTKPVPFSALNEILAQSKPSLPENAGG